MKNLKPSMLPEGTVIGKTAPHYEELYLKGPKGVWEDLFSGCGHCEDHVRVSDEGWPEDKEPPIYAISCPVTKIETSNEYFGTDYKVVAVPPGFVFDACALHGYDWDLDANTHIDGTPAHDCKGYNCND